MRKFLVAVAVLAVALPIFAGCELKVVDNNKKNTGNGAVAAGVYTISASTLNPTPTNVGSMDTSTFSSLLLAAHTGSKIEVLANGGIKLTYVGPSTGSVLSYTTDLLGTDAYITDNGVHTVIKNGVVTATTLGTVQNYTNLMRSCTFTSSGNNLTVTYKISSVDDANTYMTWVYTYTK